MSILKDYSKEKYIRIAFQGTSTKILFKSNGIYFFLGAFSCIISCAFKKF